MTGFRLIICGLLGFLLLSASCTSPRWTVKDEHAVDRNDYEILDRTRFLSQVGEVTPQNPVLRLQLLSHTSYEYAEKILLQRNIQEFRLRPGFLALSLVGAGLAIYTANGTAIGGSKTPSQRVTLNVVGGIIALSGILNMKPAGDPRPTGEERFLRRTGSRIESDTLQIAPTETDSAIVTVSYKDRFLINEAERSFNEDLMEVPLGSYLEELQIVGEEPGILNVQLAYRDSTYRFRHPVETILQPYAQITSAVTELRNQPSDTSGSVLAELAEGSQLQIVEKSGEEWYKVLYGISENYIRQADTRLIWRSSEFARENRVIAMPQVPFGNIDVENNIPIFRGVKQNAIGLIIVNENYTGDLPGRIYARRDGRLIRTYLENALGYPAEQIITLEGIESSRIVNEKLNQIRAMATDSTELFVFISGYGVIQQEGSDMRFSLLPVDLGAVENSEKPTIDLSELYVSIGSIPAAKTIVLADINFREATPDSIFQNNDLLLDQSLRNITSLITNKKSQSVVLMGSDLEQSSFAYVSGSAGIDKKHRIFPYFFASALQQRITSMGDIYQYLVRNVSYTSRKLHDMAQDPQVSGNLSINLANE